MSTHLYKCFWQRTSVGIGALLTILFLLPGCGSDSNPLKSDKAAAHKGHGVARSIPLVLDDKRVEGEVGKSALKKEPLPMTINSLGITRKEMEEKNAEAVKIAKSPGKAVINGLTKEEMDGKNAAAVQIAKSSNIQILPGATREEMARRNAAALISAPPWFVQKMAQESAQAAAQPPAKPNFPTEAK